MVEAVSVILQGGSRLRGGKRIFKGCSFASSLSGFGLAGE